MARDTNPLRREAIDVVARLPQATTQAPRTNAALQLADSLARLDPEAQRAMQGIASDRADKARAQAKKDAIQASGAELAQAVRDGLIEPTQNPWYMDAYKKESAAIRGGDALQQLQTESASWEEATDPDAFAKRWREEVGSLAGTFEGPEAAAGFVAAEQAVTSQVLQQNVARNQQRIQTERKNNLAMLSSQALAQAYAETGGRLSPNQVYEVTSAAREQWFGTGGDEAGWYQIMQNALTSTAYGVLDDGVLDLARAPEIIYGPSEAGNFTAVAPDEDYQGVTITPVDPSEEGGEPTLTVTAPQRNGFENPLPVQGRITSGFGTREAPIPGASTNHQAIDIAAPAGTPIQAQAVGRVISAKREGDAGNVVRVDYGGGVVASYAHMQGFNVAEGDMVAPGQSLGGAGRTGNASGNHVHYTLRVNGERVDPTKFNGQIGGDFEGVKTQAQGTDFEGYQAGEGGQPPAPQNNYSRGPSLYGLPGVADAIENDRYRISAARRNRPLERMEQVTNQRKERAFAGVDALLQTHGVGLYQGDVPRDQMIQELLDQGLTAPEVGMALDQIRGPLGDSVAVAQAQIAARAQTAPGGQKLLDLTVRARRDGWSEEFGDELDDAILAGEMDGNDAASLASTALARSDTVNERAEADQRREASGTKLTPSGRATTATALKQEADNLAALSALKLQSLGLRGEGLANAEGRIQSAALRAARAHLAINPADYDGAYAAARSAAVNAGKQEEARLTR